MKLLIPTEPDDTHALFVKIVLEEMGHTARLLFTADHPTKQCNSVYLDQNQHYHWKSSDEFNAYDDNDYDVVWWRRARKPHVPKKLSHPDDYQFVVRENNLFHESLTSNLAPQAWWINDKEAATRANFKLLQLRIASECQLMIPETLCSNDPDDIKRFIMKHKSQDVIYKPLCSNFWFEEDKVKITYTQKIKLADLRNMDLLQLVPGIYQHEIKKKYELRVTCFGRYCVAAKIDSQTHPTTQLDWRSFEDNLTIQPYQLPLSLEKKIYQFMDKLGIIFGSFDFIVTPDNQYVFLEVNEQGQFLWIEDFNPEIKMLDVFINFILNKSKQFIWNPKHFKHSTEKYRNKLQKPLKENMERHVYLNGVITKA